MMHLQQWGAAAARLYKCMSPHVCAAGIALARWLSAGRCTIGSILRRGLCWSRKLRLHTALHPLLW